MDFEEFADSTDPDGVFRDFPENPLKMLIISHYSLKTDNFEPRAEYVIIDFHTP